MTEAFNPAAAARSALDSDHSHHHGDHGHSHAHTALFSTGLVSEAERAQAARQITLALVALALLVLGLLWPVLSEANAQIGQILMAGAAALVAIPVLGAAWHSLRHPSLHGVTDQLIALAMLAAFATGDLTTAAFLPIVMIFGHVLEERSVMGSEEAMRALARMTRTRARLLRPDGSVEETDNDRLVSGDRVEVRAGDRIPADGRILSGSASLDTAPVTGESVPAEVREGMDVFGGTINLNGRLEVEVTRTGEASTLGRVIALMQQAERAKPPITRLLERYAHHYLLLVLALAALAWFFTHDEQVMLAVLVAACPCALVLSAPATAVAGIAVAARHGILIRGSAFLEELADLSSLIIDKTGTLTEGSLSLHGIDWVPELAGPQAATQRSDITALAAALAAASSHPVSRAIAALVAAPDRPALSALSESQGLGLTARTTDDWALALGRPELFARLGIPCPALPDHDGPLAGLAVDGRFSAWFLLSDRERPEARDALRDLASLGFRRQLLLTGDRARVAKRLADDLGIEAVVAEALPADKLAEVSAEIERGYRPVVVGDGINDSLALKAGVVGIAMGSGSADIALASSDVILVGNDLRRIGTAVRLSRLCRQTLRVNVLIGLGWTVGIIALAAFGLLGSAGALVAALLHNVSTLAVLANAGRLMRYHERLAPSDLRADLKVTTGN